MRRRKQPIHPIVMIGIILCLLIFLAYSLLSFTNKAEEVVNRFYSYEQLGNFSSSWELFHPIMKEKFTQGAYVQDRAHVFIGHFGAESFSYKINNSDKVKNWKATKDGEVFKLAHYFQVVQTYKGKYGKFSFTQEVYVVKVEDGWGIVWDYR
jgi:hypothetical protein